MKILCKAAPAIKPIMPTNQMVNKVGKYLNRNLDGAFKFVTSSNMCDVYMTLLYQLPRLQQIPGKGREYNDVHEMTLDINLTTYQNKLRVNVIERDPMERTLLYFLIKPEDLQDLEKVKHLVFAKVAAAVQKYYKDYIFLGI